MYTEEEINIIRLFRSKNIGINIFHKLINNYKTATNFIENSFLYKSKKPIEIETKENILQEIELTEKFNARLITYLHPKYPPLLKEIETFPPVLIVKGNMDILQESKTLAVIGSRTASINNINFTRRIAKEMGVYGYKIISGLARGIDSAAHLGSIKTGTISVMAGGISKIYPKENENLYYEIIENGGCIITENHFNCPPRPEMFPLRNRIIAGLSKGILVVDAGLMSGSLHTAGQAIKFNRELMVFPGSPYDDRCSGSNKLIQQGANMVVDSRDIIECLEDFCYFNSRIEEKGEINLEKFNEISMLEKPFRQEETPIFIEDTKENKELTIEDYILNNLDNSSVEVALLIEKLTNKFPINKINASLMKLKLNNKIILEGNKVYLKK